MSIWYYASSGERHGPHSIDELRQFATSGRLATDDLVWQEGMADWVQASSVKALFPPAGAIASTPASASRPPPMPVTAPGDEVIEDTDPPLLWNPNAAALWSLLFSPAFGAWIHAKNWEALNRSDKARMSMMYVYIVLALMVLVLFLPENTGRGIGPGILAAWYITLGREQVRLAKTELNGIYRKRSWGKPLGLAVAALVGYVLVVAVTLSIFDPEQGSNDAPASTQRPL